MGEIDQLHSPEPLTEQHDCSDFCCGEPTLDLWLRTRARANQASGASRSYVLCDGLRVVGYYALSSGIVMAEEVPGRFRRNMPDPIPVVLLARLAVDDGWHGRGIGRSLFRDAARRVLQAAETIGIRGIVVHALSTKARDFYLALGFDPSPTKPMMLMVSLTDIRAALQ